MEDLKNFGFKPCYKWTTFNTVMSFVMQSHIIGFVLNLVINGLPSIQNIYITPKVGPNLEEVLNLVINGLPSIPKGSNSIRVTRILWCFKPCYKWTTFNTLAAVAVGAGCYYSFKPCYKWTTFNTIANLACASSVAKVLNLVINGLPSIQ